MLTPAHPSAVAPRPARRARRLAASVAVAAAIFTCLVVFVHGFDVAYRSPPMHVAIETVAAVIGLVAAYLLAGRYRLSGQLADLLLCLSLLVLALGSLFFSVVPAAYTRVDVTRFSTWAPIMSNLLGAIGLAVAALSQRHSPPRPRTVVAAVVAFLVMMSAIAAVTAVLEGRLPVAVPPVLSPVRGGRELVIGAPSVLAIQLVTMCLFACAAVGFLRKVERESYELMETFAVAAVLGSFFAFNYFLFPSLYSEWVYSGDILRFSFYVIILVGAARELNRYWRGLAQTAALEERRRIARDLHDGLAQELAFIINQSKLLPRGPVSGKLSSAAERALGESRQAIDALTRPLDEPVDGLVTRAAEEVATRFGVHLRLELAAGVSAAPAARDALRRIVREATINAARHGHAQEVSVSLAPLNGGLRLQVRDDGAGFDPASTSDAKGFGLVSMRERAATVGGELRIDSRRGAGTVVELILP